MSTFVSGPKTAMVMAAGLGTRLRPLTDRIPKALVQVAGRTMIDHALDRLLAAGVERVVVNIHAHADALEAHLRSRREGPEVLISDERAALLETGGGIKQARPLLGDAPVYVLNSDYVWRDPGDQLARLAAAWDPARTDAVLTVVPRERTLGFDGPGDFFADADGRLTHRGAAARAPLDCFGVQIIDPTLVYAQPETRFSTFQVWMQAQGRGRLFGVEPPGLWTQVGDPRSLEVVEQALAARPEAPA